MGFVQSNEFFDFESIPIKVSWVGVEPVGGCSAQTASSVFFFSTVGLARGIDTVGFAPSFAQANLIHQSEGTS